MVRRQVIGLGFGVPHIKNVLRRVIQTSPGGHLDPRSYARAAKVLFSDELRKRGIAGVNDPAFDALLRHAGISDHGVESYRSYLDSNTDAGRMERAWKMVMVHHIIFGPGGIDQRARLWLYDFIRSQEPGITDDEMAQRINDQLGRYNKASWTDFQKDVQPFTFFPGWDYSSVSWVLRHPLKSTVPAALLVLIANLVLHALRKNQRQDSTDLSRVHYGKYSIGDNLFSERLGKAQAGSAMRFAQSKLLGKNNEKSLRDSLGGIQSDARAFVGMLNPLVATIPEVVSGNRAHASRSDPFMGVAPAGDSCCLSVANNTSFGCYVVGVTSAADAVGSSALARSVIAESAFSI